MTAITFEFEVFGGTVSDMDQAARDQIHRLDPPGSGRGYYYELEIEPHVRTHDGPVLQWRARCRGGFSER